MSFEQHALMEFRAAGWIDADGNYCDEMQQTMCEGILDLLKVFSDQGHSGSTAPYAIAQFARLTEFKPLAPLTGEEWEWAEPHDKEGNLRQNRRCGTVFTDASTGRTYDIDGRVFWEWRSSTDIDDGRPFKSYWVGRESAVDITFPYTPPKKPEYVFVPNNEYPNETLDG